MTETLDKAIVHFRAIANTLPGFSPADTPALSPAEKSKMRGARVINVPSAENPESSRSTRKVAKPKPGTKSATDRDRRKSLEDLFLKLSVDQKSGVEQHIRAFCLLWERIRKPASERLLDLHPWLMQRLPAGDYESAWGFRRDEWLLAWVKVCFEEGQTIIYDLERVKSVFAESESCGANKALSENETKSNGLETPKADAEAKSQETPNIDLPPCPKGIVENVHELLGNAAVKLSMNGWFKIGALGYAVSSISKDQRKVWCRAMSKDKNPWLEKRGEGSKREYRRRSLPPRFPKILPK